MKSALFVVFLAPALGLLACAPGRAGEKAPATYTIQLPPQPDYSGIRWMQGDWTGKTTGKGLQGEVLLSVAYELGKRFVILREEVSLPATKQAPATHESLMGILGPESGGGLAMNLYSSSGFVTRYRVVTRGPEVDFEPEGGALAPPGWLFRRIFTRSSPGHCVETVDVAPPQQAFFNYYTVSLSRITRPPAAVAGAGTNNSAATRDKNSQP